jgi:hypothetical protein
MLFEPFRPPKPENSIFRRYALDGQGPREDRGWSAKCGLRWLKAPSGMGQIRSLEVLRLRAIKRCVTR